MASTYSDLKIELIGTGDQSGTWGTTTNNNLSTALGEAITGSADVSFSSADVTVTLTDTNAAQTARNLRLNLTGTSGGARNLILGSGCQIEKLYLINNGLADTVTVKNTSGTGIAVPAGKTMFVYNNGTNVVDAITHATSLTLGSALPVASGGTGTSTAFTTGSVVFAGASGTYTQDNTNFFWDDTNNYLGIGTASPAATLNVVTNTTTDAVRITQTGTGNAFVVEDSANPDATPFVINTNGFVFIGQTTSIASASGSHLLQISGATTPLSLNRYANSSTGINLDFNFARSGGAVVASGDRLGRIVFAGSDGTSPIAAAYIDTSVDGTPGTNDMPGRLIFSTTPSGSNTPTERMRIGSNGNVGIGATGISNTSLRISSTTTGSTTSYGVYADGQIQSDVTTSGRSFGTLTNVASGAFTVGEVTGFYVGQGTLGATVTNQFGFQAASTLTGATNNYGFYSNIASGTGRWNFYANGTANNYFAGNILAGNTTSYPVTISGIAVNPSIQNSGTSANGSALGIYRWQNSNTAAANFVLAKSRGTTQGTHVALVSGDETGRVNFHGSDGTSFIPAANISTEVDGTPATNDMPGRLVFSTTPSGSATPTERMRITSAGNVGIGTSSPSTGVHLQKASGNTYYRAQNNLANVDFGVDGAGTGILWNNSNYPLAFGTNNTERTRITSDGNLLVGTTSSPSSAYRFYAASPNDLSNGAYRATSSTGFGVWDIYSDVGGTQVIKYSIAANGTAGAVSDKRQKKNIEPSRSYLDDLMKIRVVKYNWITDNDSAPKELGWIAQEVEQVFPGMVSDTTDGNFKILKKEVFIPMLLTAIQEQQTIINDLKARVETLETK
jgi:hypothetical protein